MSVKARLRKISRAGDLNMWWFRPKLLIISIVKKLQKLIFFETYILMAILRSLYSFGIWNIWASEERLIFALWSPSDAWICFSALSQQSWPDSQHQGCMQTSQSSDIGHCPCPCGAHSSRNGPSVPAALIDLGFWTETGIRDCQIREMEILVQCIPCTKILNTHVSLSRVLTLMLKCSKKVSGRLLGKLCCCAKGEERSQSLQGKSSAHSLVLLTGKEGKRTGIYAAVIYCSSGSKSSCIFQCWLPLFCRWWITDPLAAMTFSLIVFPQISSELRETGMKWDSPVGVWDFPALAQCINKGSFLQSLWADSQLLAWSWLE